MTVAELAEAALMGTAMLTGVVLALCALVIVRRSLAHYRVTRVERIWGEALNCAAAGLDLPACPPLRRGDAAVVLEAWLRRRSVVRDGSELARLAHRTGLADAALRLLRRGRGRARVTAAAACGHLGLERAEARLTRLVQRGQDPIATAALAALIRLDAPVAVPLLARRLRPGPQPLPSAVTAALVEARLNRISVRLREEAAAALATGPGLLRLLALRREPRAREVARATLTEPGAEPEALAAALFALAETGTPGDAAVVRPLLTHASVAVRVRATHAFARLGGVAARAELVTLLDDPDPWVRRRAAEAIAELDPTLFDDLDLRVEQWSDRAREALAEALTLRGLARAPAVIVR